MPSIRRETIVKSLVEYRLVPSGYGSRPELSRIV